MKVTQFVMAYGAEQDRIRAILPDGFRSLRPVLRINAEIRGESVGYVEFNVPVEAFDKRGWLNIDHWENVPYFITDRTVCFRTEFLTITFTPVGITGSCPAEKDNDGCFFLRQGIAFREAERITANKEFCDCSFSWQFHENDAKGVSIGKTLPAFYSEPQKQYPKRSFTAENATAISCEQVLGSYTVTFEREDESSL